MKTLNLRNSIGRSLLRLDLPRVQRIWIIRGSVLIIFALGCFALSVAPNAFGVVPAPDGGYPGNNTAEGANALFSLTSGTANTALGFQALYRNTTGNYNTAEGFRSLFSNTTGDQNTASGAQALFSNTTADYNTALGVNALYRNTTGTENTAVGVQALFNNTIGDHNAALGTSSLYRNTVGDENAATGWQALFNNTSGDLNTAIGKQALFSNTTGTLNTAAGARALFFNVSGTNNTAYGSTALAQSTGSYNIGLGNSGGYNLTTGSNNIDIGNDGVAGESNTIRIGTVGTQQATYIAGISGKTAAGGAAVFVASNGKLGTVTSSRRFKKDIADMDAASEALLALRPVTFRYKPEIDKAGIPQYGLVAEEVAEVNPDLVVRDEKGEIYTVRYEAVNAMLLNEFLKAHRRIEEQDKRIDQLTAQLKEQALLIQKVNDKVELNRFATGRIRRGGPAPQTVADDR
jgi:Chaperone of endosialidase